MDIGTAKPDKTILKAIKHHIEIFTKGHAINRLYLPCPDKKWQRFYRLIMDRCVVEPAVKCPKWLQKTMLKNLKKSSTNRLWPDRAQKAIEILKTEMTIKLIIEEKVKGLKDL